MTIRIAKNQDRSRQQPRQGGWSVFVAIALASATACSRAPTGECDSMMGCGAGGGVTAAPPDAGAGGGSEPVCSLGDGVCAQGRFKSCIADAQGGLRWSDETRCPSGLCGSSTSCDNCQHACPTLGETACASGDLKTCVADEHGCRGWSAPTRCRDGFCGGSSTCGECNNRCATPGETTCSAGNLKTCKVDAYGCRNWSASAACPDHFCADASRCGVCGPSCVVGASTCTAGHLKTCQTDSNGCTTWSAAASCPSGFCADTSSCGVCNHTCPVAGEVSCVGGKARTCQADSNGCRAWSAPVSCPNGFCSSTNACGACQPTCSPPGQCLWQVGSCAEVVAQRAVEIDQLSATSEGLFWQQTSNLASRELLYLPYGQQTPTVQGTVGNSSLTLVSAGDTLYAHAGGTGGRLFVKAAGQPVKAVDAWTGTSFVFSTPTDAYFAEGPSQFRTLSRIYREAIPASCPDAGWCWIGATQTFYTGDSQWPASTVATGSNSELFFVSNEYGNYPLGDVKRRSSRIMAQPFAGGPARTLVALSEKSGPDQLVHTGGSLYFLRSNHEIASAEVSTGNWQTVYAPPSAAPLPLYFAVDGADAFWLDSASQLVRLRVGSSAPEVLARTVGDRNLAVTPTAVYFTDYARKTLLRWKR